MWPGDRWTECHAGHAAAAVALSVAVMFGTLGPGVSTSSAYAAATPPATGSRSDSTDTYAFVSPDRPDTVTIVANWIPTLDPAAGPDFRSFATHRAYDINIDNDGDARPDITYRWTFDQPSVTQAYRLREIRDGHSTILVSAGRVAPAQTEAAASPAYAALADAAIAPFAGGGLSFAGPIDDPFFIDLGALDLISGGDNSGGHNSGRSVTGIGQDSVRGYTVNTTVLQVSKSDLALRGDPRRNPVIGVWTTTSRAAGGLDGGISASAELPQLIQAVLGSGLAVANPSGRADLVEAFLTGFCSTCGPYAADLNSQLLNGDVDPRRFRPSEQLRLNMTLATPAPGDHPSRLGALSGDLKGFPNGRRLTDDVVDIEMRLAAGALLPDPSVAATGFSDGVDANDVPLRSRFPYVTASTWTPTATQ
jgi:Domain of unknown function (DUF4331)